MTALGLLLVVPATAILLAVPYFRRVTVERPPVGVYTLRDIAVVMIGVVLLPLLYVALPDAVTATALGLMTVLALQLTLAPLMPGRAAFAVAAAAGAVDVVLVVAELRTPAIMWNNLLMLAVVVGIANLYVQSGVKARDVAVFGLLLAGYDLVATTMLPTMGDLLRKTMALPFAPVFASWGEPMVIGLGDVLLLTLWTLVSVKAFGRTAGWVAAGGALALTGTLALTVHSGLFPVLLAAGPLMALQYLVWHALHGTERTTATYRGHIGTNSAPTDEDVSRNLTVQLRTR